MWCEERLGAIEEKSATKNKGCDEGEWAEFLEILFEFAGCAAPMVATVDGIDKGLFGGSLVLFGTI